jgi:uncharacterized protein YjbJ (UPF0337 family)
MHMSADDKAKNAAQDMGGKIKEGVGKATGNDSQVAEGKADQRSAKLKEAGENIKDAVKD